MALYQDFKDDRRDFENLEGPPWETPLRWSPPAPPTGGGPSPPASRSTPASSRPGVSSSFLPEFPSLASAADGLVYAVWADGRNGDEDVFLARSDDGGASWRRPVRVNDNRRGDGTAQYLPRVAVAPDGRVDVVFYDRRADLSDTRNEVYLAFSRDRGETFRNLRLSSDSFDSRVGPSVAPSLGTDLGSRLGLVSTNRRAVAVWTDSRQGDETTGRQDIALGVVRLPAAPGGDAPRLAVATALLAVGAVVVGLGRAGARRRPPRATVPPAPSPTYRPAAGIRAGVPGPADTGGPRRLRAGTVLALLGLVIGGCTADRREQPQGSARRAAAQDLLVLAGEDPFQRGEPPPANVGLLAGAPGAGIFETITRLTTGFGVAPGLARRWEMTSPTTWRFVLRRGVRFHNGARFDAAAVVATLEVAARRQNRPRGLEPGAARAVAPDKVDVSLSVPNMRLPEQLANPALGVLAPGTQAGAGGEPATTPTGTGPFRFAGYTPGAELRVVAHGRYWGRRPMLSSVTIRFGPHDPATAAGAVRLLAQGVGATEPAPGERRVVARPDRSVHLLLNVGGIGEWATLKEDAIRRAVTVALDRAALTREAWPNHGEPNETLVPPVVLGDAGLRVAPPEHDQDAAGTILDAAGWLPGPGAVRQRDGRRLSLSLLLSRPVEQAVAAGAIEAQLARVGIAVERQETGAEPFAAFARVNQAAFDLFLDVRLQEDANPCALCRIFAIGPGAQLTVAGAVGAGPAADALFEQAYTTPSADATRRLAADLMHVVTAERMVAVPLASLARVWLVPAKVVGFEAAAVPGAQRWDELWIAA